MAVHGYSSEIIDLRALDMISMDWKSMEDSLARTGRGLFVDPAPRGQAIGPRLLAELVQRGGGGHQLSCLASEDVQPVARELEAQASIGVRDILASVRKLMRVAVSPNRNPYPDPLVRIPDFFSQGDVS